MKSILLTLLFLTGSNLWAEITNGNAEAADPFCNPAIVPEHIKARMTKDCRAPVDDIIEHDKAVKFHVRNAILFIRTTRVGEGDKVSLMISSACDASPNKVTSPRRYIPFCGYKRVKYDMSSPMALDTLKEIREDLKKTDKKKLSPEAFDKEVERKYRDENNRWVSDVVENISQVDDKTVAIDIMEKQMDGVCVGDRKWTYEYSCPEVKKQPAAAPVYGPPPAPTAKPQ